MCIYEKWKWHTTKYGDPYLEFVLCMYPSKVHTHSSEHTHIVNTHTWSSGQPVMLQRMGSSRDSVPCSRALRHGIEGGESAVHSLPPPTIPAGPRLEHATFDYESDSLTIRPRLPYLRWTQQHYKRVNRGSVRCNKTEMMLVRLTTSRSNWCS